MSYQDDIDDTERLKYYAEEADSKLYAYTDLINMNLFYKTNPAPCKAPIMGHRIEGVGMADGMYRDVVIPIQKLRETPVKEVPLPGKRVSKCQKQRSQ